MIVTIERDLFSTDWIVDCGTGRESGPIGKATMIGDRQTKLTLDGLRGSEINVADHWMRQHVRVKMVISGEVNTAPDLLKQASDKARPAMYEQCQALAVQQTGLTEAQIDEQAPGMLAHIHQAANHTGHCLAITRYLDAEHDRRTAFESAVLDRLAKLERKTSSTEPVELPENPFAPGGVYSKEPLAHVAHRDSLSRYGTGHPSERCCKRCGRPTFDRIDAYRNTAGEPFCNKACCDSHDWDNASSSERKP